MRKTFLPGVGLLLISLLLTKLSFGQKKTLDPSVYDHWENIGEKLLSPDGKYLVYTVVPQEGDGRLVIRATGNDYAKEIPRGAMAAITATFILRGSLTRRRLLSISIRLRPSVTSTRSRPNTTGSASSSITSSYSMAK